ncbi:MAG: hypothetical protein HKP40_02350 [Litoreibacter sp.]|nr:hypothetical protein [Litoreibacter sp.]
MPPDQRYLLWKIRRYAPLVLTISLAGSLSASWFVAQWPENQIAQAKLLSEVSEVGKLIEEKHAATRQVERLEIIRHKLSRPENLLATAQRFDLYPSSPQGAEEIARRMLAALSFSVTPRRDSLKILSVSFQHSDGAKAAQIANDFAQQAIRENTALRQHDLDRALSFYRDDVAAKTAALRERNTHLGAFKTENANALNANLNQLLARRARLQEKLLEIAGPAFRKPVQAMKHREVLRLEAELVSALGRYPEQHPEVQQRQDALKVIARQLELAKELKRDTTIGRDLHHELQQVNSWIEKVPANSVQLAWLQNEYDYAEREHRVATQRLSEASIRAQAELQQEGQRLSVIEFARAPELKPNQKKLAALVLGIVASIGLGLGVAALLNRFDRRLRRPQDMIKRLGLTPFATLSTLSLGQDRDR